MHPLNAEYCLNRASRPQNSYQDNYDDAYQYMYGRRLGHPRTVPVDGHHDPREYAGPILRFGLNGRRNRDLATSRWDRIRNWSWDVDRVVLTHPALCVKEQHMIRRKKTVRRTGTYSIMRQQIL